MLTITLLLGAAAFAVADSSTPASQHFQSPECTGDSASSCSIEHDKTSLLQVQGTIELGSARSANGLEPKLDIAKHSQPIEDLSDADAEEYHEQAQQMARNAEEGFQSRTVDRVRTDLATDEVAEQEARRQTTGDQLETTLTEDEIGQHEAHRLQDAEMAHAARKEDEQIAAVTDDMDAHVNFDKDYADQHMNADTEETEMLKAKADDEAQLQAEAEHQSEGKEALMANRIGAMGGAYDGHAHMSSSGQGMDTSVQQEGMVDDNPGFAGGTVGIDNDAHYGIDNDAHYGIDNDAHYGIDNDAHYGMHNDAHYMPEDDTPGASEEAVGPLDDGMMAHTMD